CATLAVTIRVQSPTHLMWHEFLRDGGPEAPVAQIAVAPPARWTVGRQQTYRLTATNLGERTWFAARPAQVFVHVMFVGPGADDRVDGRAELWLPIAQPIPPNGRLEMELNVT